MSTTSATTSRHQSLRNTAANTTAESAILIGAGSLAIALLAQFAVQLPFTPVPITGQTLAVFLVAGALGARRGIAAVALYLIEGACGLPVFAAGALAPSAGYLAGFVAAAAIVGFAADRGWDRSWAKSLLALLCAQLAVYALGVVWLALFVGREHVLALGVAPFLAGDAVKLAIAALLLPGTRRALEHV